jgi:hypothetical protein
MSPEEITNRCQKAIEKASIPAGINLCTRDQQTASGIRIQCKTEEQAKQLCPLELERGLRRNDDT